MNKKANLRRGLDSVFSTPAEGKEPIDQLAARARTQLRQRKTDDRPLKEKGCKPGETRATILIEIALLEKVKNLVYWTPGATIKEVMSVALEAYIEKHEKKHGPIKQRKK